MHTGVVTSESERPVAPDRESVERELDAILRSAHFRGSRRCQGFLSYVVNKTLDGQTESLREREIAIAVFGTVRLPGRMFRSRSREISTILATLQSRSSRSTAFASPTFFMRR